MNLHNIINSLQYNTAIGLYLENKIGYEYEWLIDFLNQFTSSSIEELVALIHNLKAHCLTHNIQTLVSENDSYTYEHELLGNVLFVSGDSDGTQLLFCFKNSNFVVENVFLPNEGCHLDGINLLSYLQDWLFCLQNGHLPITLGLNGSKNSINEIRIFYNKHPDYSKEIKSMKALNFYIKLSSKITNLRDFSQSRPLLIREQIELSFLEKIQAADSLAALESLENELNNTPTDAGLLKQLIKYTAEKKTFY